MKTNTVIIFDDKKDGIRFRFLLFIRALIRASFNTFVKDNAACSASLQYKTIITLFFLITLLLYSFNILLK